MGGKVDRGFGSPRSKTFLFRNVNGTDMVEDVELGSINPTDLAWADLDMDGDLDLVLSRSNGTEIYENQSGNLVRLTSIGIGDSSQAPIRSGGTVDVADFNRDGIQDLVISGNYFSREKTEVYISSPSDGFAFRFLEPISLADGQKGTVSVGDLNNDGYMDVVLGGMQKRFEHKLYVNLADGSGNFDTDPSAIQNLGVSLSSTSMAWGDINNDGYMDLITSGIEDNGTRSVYQLLNNAGTNFLPAETMLADLSASGSVVLGDMDQDSDLDLLVAGEDSLGTPRTYYLENKIKTPSFDLSPNGAPNKVALADPPAEQIDGELIISWLTATDDLSNPTPGEALVYDVVLDQNRSIKARNNGLGIYPVHSGSGGSRLNSLVF